eukprot:gene5989-7199_t
MPLIYAFVARGTTILADYTAYTGNFSTVAIQCLQNCPEGDTRFIKTCDGYHFCFSIDSGYTFLVVSDAETGKALPYAFLQRVRDDFVPKYGNQATNALGNSLDKEYGPKLKGHLDYCESHPEELSKVAMIHKQVADVKDIMMENIEKVLDRGEKIELLVDKTEDLRFKADNFYKTGRQLRRKMWWDNVKMKLLVLFLIVLVIG